MRVRYDSFVMIGNFFIFTLTLTGIMSRTGACRRNVTQHKKEHLSRK